MQIQKITTLLEQINARLVVLLCHQNADPDAICAAFAFSKLLQRLKPQIKIEISAALGPSRLSKHLLNFLPLTLASQPRIEEADAIVLLDTNTIQQLADWAERVRTARAPLIVVDHHASHPETELLAKLIITEEESSSTCEIVYKFFKELSIIPSEIEAKALFLGITFDTRHFVLAKSSTLKTVADLIDAGVKAEETLSLLSLPMDQSERIARLKACRRVKLMKVNDWLLAFSHVSAYQASAARALISLGVHVAAVGGQREEKIQISLRATKEFYKETEIHLGRDIAKPLGEYLKGMGGGHSLSAGVNGTGDLEASLKRCARLLREALAKGPTAGTGELEKTG